VAKSRVCSVISLNILQQYLTVEFAQVAASYAVMLLYIALALGYLPAGARPWALLVTGRLGEAEGTCACMHVCMLLTVVDAACCAASVLLVDHGCEVIVACMLHQAGFWLAHGIYRYFGLR
jgi:hypothetical protein